VDRRARRRDRRLGMELRRLVSLHLDGTLERALLCSRINSPWLHRVDAKRKAGNNGHSGTQ
jgi:hypothetical protein